MQEIHWSVASHTPPTGNLPRNSGMCPLTGNRTSDLLVCRLALNPLSHTSQVHRKHFLNAILLPFEKGTLPDTYFRALSLHCMSTQKFPGNKGGLSLCLFSQLHTVSPLGTLNWCKSFCGSAALLRSCCLMSVFISHLYPQSSQIVSLSHNPCGLIALMRPTFT